MSATATEIERRRMEEAEELIVAGGDRAGFAKDLFFGRFRTQAVMPYPLLPPERQRASDELVAQVRAFALERIDPDRIDREADIPEEVIHGLGELGVLGLTISPQYGGHGCSQYEYCRVMEVIGARCASTAVFVNAHHSIGLRALELFGTEEQKQRWLPDLAAGAKLAAFALTEPEAGSDAANVRTRAEPTEDGSAFILNGEKRYITNGAIAQVLTVMARTPAPSDPDGRVSAFLVTPDMPGFEVVEARMEKCGIRGTATARLAFRDMRVPRENLLGPEGKGLRVALTVLDFGRTTFGATCTGAAKFCVSQMIDYAGKRRQFGRAIGEFELIKEKIALAAADTFAMESATYHTASLIDSGAEDYMLETAMLKVFASERLWRIVNDALQVHGGAGFFTDLPFERMMRDARLNLIGEGANEVLRSFIAMVGLRGVGKQLEGVLQRPWTAGRLWRANPPLPVPHPQLQPAAQRLRKHIGRLGRWARNVLIRYREGILHRQLVHTRLADAATELYMAACVYARLVSLLDRPGVSTDAAAQQQLRIGLFYLQLADARLKALLGRVDAETDAPLAALADELRQQGFPSPLEETSGLL